MEDEIQKTIACVCENRSSIRTFAQHGAFGSRCMSCGAQGPVTSLISVLPTIHLKARITVESPQADEVVGPVSEYADWIRERAGRGAMVLIDFFKCELCGGLITIECVHQMVTERCLSCQHEVQFSMHVARPSLPPPEPRQYRIRNPHPKAAAISLLRTQMSPNLELSLASMQARLQSEEGVLLDFEDASSAEPVLDQLAILGCQIERM